MPIELRPQENVFFPMPYVAGEPHLLLITNQRVVQFGDAGRQELATRDIHFVSRATERPLVLVAAVLLVLALPLLAVGAYVVLSTGGTTLSLPTVAPAAPVGDDPAGPAAGADEAAGAGGGSPGPIASRPVGFGLAGGGVALLLGAAIFGTRLRYMVMVRGGRTFLSLRAQNQSEQTQLLATLQAVQEAAKSAPAVASPAAAPAVEVDDKGDPVKALQELSAARAAGKVPEEEFLAKREALLSRVRARK